MNSTVEQAFADAAERQNAGQFEEARAIYEGILAEQPDHPDALNLLGITLARQGKNEEAVGFMKRATEIRPGVPIYWNNLGLALTSLGRLDEAVAAFGEAIGISREYAEAHSNLGNALTLQFRHEAAIDSYREAIRLRPDYSQAYSNISTPLTHLGRHDEAVAAAKKGIALRPDYPAGLFNLGFALEHAGRLEEALSSYRRAVELRPNWAAALTAAGEVLSELGRIDEALASYQSALKNDPNYALAHWNRALALLLAGDWDHGFEEYEWRWRLDTFKSTRPAHPELHWNGSDPGGKRILLYTEQGFGDAIQFFRYATALSRRGGRVIVQARAELVRLFEETAGIEIVANDGPPPAYDVHFPLLSLPRLFKTTVQTIPGEVPYLRANAKLTEQWRGRVPGRNILKVGLVWRGSVIPDARRSIPTELLAPLGRVPNVWFTNLQVGDSSAPAPFAITDWRGELKDFADTAALMANLDLIVTIDSAAAHLAGALGKPTWTMLKLMPDWRWLLGREDTPFYPTMRLFRQSARDDWAGVIARVAGDLRVLAEKQAQLA
jgi:tetratricopeptide (TPR) repeat protein